MRRISQSFGVDQGSILLFSDFHDGGVMWSGHGPRESRHPIRFAQRFTSPPVVTVSISLWDVASGFNLRADLRAESIHADRFELVFRTWGDTRIARLRADWTAIGGLPDTEIWDLGEG